ncbi:MAG: hypothetical protein J6A89_05805 [Clostridia bacterium]|nr:hypothetical protein [Clostridia bacterium]
MINTELGKLRRNISTNIEPVLIIDEEDRSGFLDEVLSYGEVSYSK